MTYDGGKMQKIPKAPPLDTAQRQAGYDRSLQLRRARAVVKASLASGELSLVEVLGLDETQGMKVRGLLLALPGVGARRADRLLQAAGINPARSVTQLGNLQRKALLYALHSWQKV